MTFEYLNNFNKVTKKVYASMKKTCQHFINGHSFAFETAQKELFGLNKDRITPGSPHFIFTNEEKDE